MKLITSKTDASFDYGAGYFVSIVDNGFEIIKNKVHGLGHFSYISDIADICDVISEIDRLILEKAVTDSDEVENFMEKLRDIAIKAERGKNGIC